MHFERHRGLALSIVLCGTGLTAALLPSALSWAIGRWGWQGGFATLAALPLAMWVSLVWRALPSRVSAAAVHLDSLARSNVEGMAFREAVTSRNFWICNVGLGLVTSAIYALATNTVPLLRGIGLSAQAASGVFTAFGISLIVGRLAVGLLLDRFWAPAVAAVALAPPAVGCALLLGADSSTPFFVLILATALCGIGSGAEFDIAAYLVSRYFGLRDYGRLFGVHLGLVTVGSALAPFGFAALLRRSGGYDAMLLLCAAACVLGPVLLLALGAYPVRVAASSHHREPS
jgi:MFS family permease